MEFAYINYKKTIDYMHKIFTSNHSICILFQKTFIFWIYFAWRNSLYISANQKTQSESIWIEQPIKTMLEGQHLSSLRPIVLSFWLSEDEPFSMPCSLIYSFINGICPKVTVTWFCYERTGCVYGSTIDFINYLIDCQLEIFSLSSFDVSGQKLNHELLHQLLLLENI